MDKKVKIKKLPEFRGGGMFGSQTPPRDEFKNPYIYSAAPEIKIRTTLGPTPRANANLEAERNETVLTNLQGEGLPEFFNIGGKPHSRGGTPLNLPANSFFFSQNKQMAIKDPEILSMFGKTGKKGSFTPAELSKRYNTNKYRQILVDPLSTKLERETAERMIKNYNMKLGALALAQESIKGFDNGIPVVSLGYMEENGIQPDQLLTAGVSADTQMPQFKGGGQHEGSYKVRIKSLSRSLPRYQDGSVVTTSETRYKTPPAKSIKWDPEKKGYDESLVREGHYIRQKDGSWKRVKGYKAVDYTGEIDSDERLGDFAKGYSMVSQKFQNPELKNKIVAEYRKAVKDMKPAGNLSAADIKAMQEMGEEEIIKNFLDLQRKNLAFNNKYGNIDNLDFNKELDKDPNLANKKLVELGYDPMSAAQVGAAQTVYNALYEVAKDPVGKQLLKGLKLRQVGTSNKSQSINEEGSISRADGFYGNTTLGEVLLPSDGEMDFEDLGTYEEETKHLGNSARELPARFWTQDLVNMTGALGDRFGVNKHNPWQPTPQWHAATPEFMDFRGTAARIGAQGTGLANTAAQYAGPQSQAALQQSIQRNMADPILKAQEMEQTANIETANKFNMFNTQSKNQYNLQKAAMDTQLFDKQQTVNQQFDNTKRALKWNMLNAFNQAWTNRGKTQTLNASQDNFAVDPITGMTYFTGDNRDLQERNQAATYEETVERLINAHPDWSEDTILAVAKQVNGEDDDADTSTTKKKSKSSRKGLADYGLTVDDLFPQQGQ